MENIGMGRLSTDPEWLYEMIGKRNELYYQRLYNAPEIGYKLRDEEFDSLDKELLKLARTYRIASGLLDFMDNFVNKETRRLEKLEKI